MSRARVCARAPALGLLFLAAACGTGDRPGERDGRGHRAQEIVGGQLAPDDAAVFLLRMFDARGDEYTCTATLIAPRTLLTAAHCLDDPNLTVWATNALHGSTVAPAQLLPVGARRVHPLWNNKSPDFEHDVAVAKLDAAPGVAPVAWSAQSPLPLVGEAVRAAGYGATHPVNGGEGSRRTVALRVDEVDATHLYVTGEAKGFCYGDSGGPTFFRFPDGVERIVGVHSFNWDDACTYGGDTRLDLPEHVAFIEGWLAEHEPPPAPPDAGTSMDAGTSPDAGTGGEADAGTPPGASVVLPALHSGELPRADGGGCSAAPAGLAGPLWTGLLWGLAVATARRRRRTPRLR